MKWYTIHGVYFNELQRRYMIANDPTVERLFKRVFISGKPIPFPTTPESVNQLRGAE